LPEKLVKIHLIETDDATGIERYRHARFADKHQNGEWFAPPPSDVAAFKRWRKII
jgi:hypothetical protein